MIQVPAFLIDNPMAVFNFSISNGKVVFITEDRDPNLINLPNRLDASVLLPPYEATAAELDGNLNLAEQYYAQWLSTKECMDYINLIALALMKNIPVAVYFGPELQEMRYPTLFMNYFIRTTGINFGYGNQPGVMDEQFIPINLANFLSMDLIDVPEYFAMMPVGCDLPPAIIPILNYILRPMMKPSSTIQEYNEYYKDLIKQIHESGKYLYCPIVSGGPGS